MQNDQEIRELLASGDLELAIQALLSTSLNSGKRDTAVQISGRFKTLKYKELQGIISSENATLERNQIRHDLLRLLESDDAAPIAKIAWGWKKIAAAIVSIILFGGALAEFTGYSVRDFFRTKPDPAPTEQPKEKLSTPNSTAPASTTTQIGSPTQQPAQQQSTNPGRPSTVSKDTTLRISCRTDKGSKNLHYRNGEAMRLFVNVNQPCYLRVIYRLAGGELTLLENDRQISANETHRDLEIGAGFICSEPFGAETLYVFAQSAPFKPLLIEKSDDYDLIKEGLAGTLSKTRGFKKTNRFAEAKLDILTSER